MINRISVILFAVAIVLSLSFYGCKGKVEKEPDTQLTEMDQGMMVEVSDSLVTTEPAQVVATETIPPTATPQITPAPKPYPGAMDESSRNKDIQIALKNAGFYTGAIDGKIGPKSKKAIEDFQSAHGLKVDGKVGPKTWAELEKYLVKQ